MTSSGSISLLHILMLGYLQRRWFLVGLALLIPVGLLLGMQWGSLDTEMISKYVPARLLTGIIIFLMSVTLDSTQFQSALKAPAPFVWATIVNFLFIPVMGMMLMKIQSPIDFQIGLMIAASVPCTMAAASVWTRKAGGNDAVSLLVTLVTNSCCVFITPFWLNLATSANVTLNLREMITRLVLTVLIPVGLGQIVRLSPPIGHWASLRKTPIGVVAQTLILILVFSASLRAGLRLRTGQNVPSGLSVLGVWASCLFLHLTAMGIGFRVASLLRFSLKDQIAVAFAGSQKTLPIGILIASDLAQNHPGTLSFALFPMLMFHATQLFVDTAIAQRFALRFENEPPQST